MITEFTRKIEEGDVYFTISELEYIDEDYVQRKVSWLALTDSDEQIEYEKN